MSRTLIPVEIRAHLIPFLFQEFPGVDARFQGKKVKAVKIFTHNTFGKMIRFLAEQSDAPASCDQRYSIYLSINEQVTKIEYFGKIYRYADGRHSFLKIPEEGVKMINDHLESIFRSAMMYYLDGWSQKEGNQGIREGINIFMEKYRLLEFGFDPESMRRNYYRWKKNDKRLSFFINQASNRVHNYQVSQNSR